MDPKELARQLRKPEGETGIFIGNKMNEGNARMYQLAFDNLNLQDNDRILEIGFGNGKFIPDILAQAKDVRYAGIDFSPDMTAEAEKLIKEKNLSGKAEVKLANLSSIPYPDQSFDKVLTVNTIYFWENPAMDIREIYRVLKPGGALLLCFRPKSMVEKLEFTKYGFRLYDPEEVMRLMESGGFRDIKDHFREEPPADFNGVMVAFASYCTKALR